MLNEFCSPNQCNVHHRGSFDRKSQDTVLFIGWARKKWTQTKNQNICSNSEIKHNMQPSFLRQWSFSQCARFQIQSHGHEEREATTERTSMRAEGHCGLGKMQALQWRCPFSTQQISNHSLGNKKKEFSYPLKDSPEIQDEES